MIDGQWEKFDKEFPLETFVIILVAAKVLLDLNKLSVWENCNGSLLMAQNDHVNIMRETTWLGT